MKKLFIIAAAALVAVAACTKTEVADNTPAKAISFSVANYATQTKANGSLVTEGYTTFTTSAWYHTAVGATAQEFMKNETIKYDGTKKWAPESRVYYWPKTGYINFFSYAGTKAFTVTEYSLVLNNATITAIGTDKDNILVADAALGYAANDDTPQYGFNNVEEGVPTLFHHMLSRVKFYIKVDASDVDDTKYNWKVDVNSAKVVYSNKGSLAVSFDAETAATPANPSWASAVWTPGTTDAELIKVSNAVSVNANGHAASDFALLIEDSVVMPQTLATTGVTFALNYTLTCTYDNANPIVETVDIPATALTSFYSTITSWDLNKIYTYNIIIKPSGKQILFDPAVEAWEEEPAVNYTINN